MINVSEAFKNAIVADVRRTAVQAIIHIVDPDIVFSAPTYSNVANWATPAEIQDENTGNLPYATFENNQWLLDGSMILADTPAINSGYVSSTKAPSGRTISAWAQINFTGVSVLQTCAVIFDGNLSNGVPEDFTITIYQAGGTVAHTETITGNKATNVVIDGFTVNSPIAIRVTATKMSLPHRRLRIAEIVPGVHETWTGDDLASLEIKQQIDLSNANLPYGTCVMAIDNLDKRFDPRNKNGLFESLEERQGVDIFIGAGDPTEFVKIGRFYMARNGWKTSVNAITLTWQLLDIIGLINERPFIVPDTLPTTLDGWVAAIMTSFNATFATMYEIEAGLETFACVCADSEMLNGITNGEMLRYLLEYVGCTAVSTVDGKLLVKTLGANEGSGLYLDNLQNYPEMSENTDIAEIIVTIQDGTFGDSHLTVGGNMATANESRTIDNPFIADSTDAQRVAFYALQFYGGMLYKAIGRGDPSSEITDIDAVVLDESNAASGRRYYQDFVFQNGVLMGCKSELLQSNGALSYSQYEVLTANQTYSFPAGVTAARILLVGGGYSGEKGTDGTWSRAGSKGADGAGGNVFVSDISFNDGASFAVVIGAAEGGATTFGAYSSDNGAAYEHGYGDLVTGTFYGRPGVITPLHNTGNGGAGGAGGKKGEREWKHNKDQIGYWDVSRIPTDGKNGSPGATGVAIVYWSE